MSTAAAAAQIARFGLSPWTLAIPLAIQVCACAQADLPVEARPTPALTNPRVEPPTAAKPPISADPTVLAIVDAAERDSRVDDLVRVLAVDIGPRLTGSTAIVEAEDWAVDQLGTWGLQATIETWGELPVGFERGPATGTQLRPERTPLEFTTSAWTPGTHAPASHDPERLDAGGPVRGQALRYPTTAKHLRELGPYLRGSWIMVPWGVARSDVDATLRKQIERAFERAPIAGVVRAAGDADDLLIRSHGDHRLDPAKLPTRVEIRLRGDQHAAVLAQMAAGEYVELEFAVGNRLLPGPVPVHNVIAELPGSEFPDQRVVIGAHLDSWDGASGAVDNATGVATTMEAARLIAEACTETGVRPRRTISFMLWSGEEQGLLGSKAWIAAHPDQLEGISAVLVHDEGTNYISGVPVTPEMFDAMAQVFAPVQRLAPTTMPFELRVVEALAWEPSDSSSFLAGQVPGLFWDQAGRSDYDRYHHTQHDHVDAVIDEYQRHSALVVAIAAWNLAQLDAPLDREYAFGPPKRMLGVTLDETVIDGLAPDGVAARAGLAVGDRVVTIDGVAIPDREALIAALQRGGPRKTITVDRPAAQPDPAQPRGGWKEPKVPTTHAAKPKILDWSDDPDEPARAQRSADRRARFEPALRPWDLPTLDEDATDHE